MIFAWDGWKEFYTFSQQRGIDWGSIFFVLQDHGLEKPATDTELLNLLGTGTFLVLAAGIAVLALAAPRRPRLAQLMFLVLVAFMLPNKVWSPQYVLWLLPLAVMARPKLPAFVAWQIGRSSTFSVSGGSCCRCPARRRARTCRTRCRRCSAWTRPRAASARTSTPWPCSPAS